MGKRFVCGMVLALGLLSMVCRKRSDPPVQALDSSACRQGSGQQLSVVALAAVSCVSAVHIFRDELVVRRGADGTGIRDSVELIPLEVRPETRLGAIAELGTKGSQVGVTIWATHDSIVIQEVGVGSEDLPDSLCHRLERRRDLFATTSSWLQASGLLYDRCLARFRDSIPGLGSAVSYDGLPMAPGRSRAVVATDGGRRMRILDGH